MTENDNAILEGLEDKAALLRRLTSLQIEFNHISESACSQGLQIEVTNIVRSLDGKVPKTEIAISLVERTHA